MVKYFNCILFVIIILVVGSCTKSNSPINNTQEMDVVNMQNLENKNIFFGHQSVGVNILNGAERYAKSQKIDFQLSKDSIQPAANKIAILHTAIGKNREPFLKIEDYKSFITKREGKGIDIAIFKLCYVDINKTTDIKTVFNAYTSAIDSLQEKFPEITFIHTTVPLRALQKGPKALIKRILGKSIGFEDNVARIKYSNLVKDKYNSDYIFDIAKFESTKQDGSREENIINGEKCFALAEEYTYDGGHLTKLGENYLGKNFILFLSNIDLK